MRPMDEESKKQLAINYLATKMIISIEAMEAHTYRAVLNNEELLMVNLGVLNILTHILGNFDLRYPIDLEDIAKRFKYLQEKNRIDGVKHIGISRMRDRTLIINPIEYEYGNKSSETIYICRAMLSILENPNSVAVFWDEE